MDEQTLVEEINKMREKIIRLASIKEDPLKDPEIYQISCQLDYLVVEYTKIKMKK